MKKLFFLGLAALLLPALVACKGGAQAKGGEIEWQDDNLLAVAFLGYYDSFAAFESSPSYVSLTQAFPQIVEAGQVLAGLGRELYLVVPRDPMASLAVDQDGEYVTDDNREVYYRSEEGKPILVLNNWFRENSLVVCTDNDGRTTRYSPALNPRTGTLRVPGDASVLDISLPLPKPMEGFTSFDYGEDYNGDDLGIRLDLRAGQPILTSSAAPLASLGYTEESIRLADGEKVFEGINGLCKGVFLGTIGQDYNPVACVVMEDGSVKMCGIFYALQHGGPELSHALPGFKDVTGFEEGGGGGWEDEETGETIYEYATIYALDARGGRTEIPYFWNWGTYLASGENHSYEAILTPDWNICLNSYEEDTGDFCETALGSFSWESDGELVEKFQFQVTSEGRNEGGEIVWKSVSRNGSFTATEHGLSYEVSLSGANYFKNNLLFRDERILDTEADREYE